MPIYCRPASLHDIFLVRPGGIMVSVLASSTVDRGFEPRSGHIKDYESYIFASLLSVQH